MIANDADIEFMGLDSDVGMRIYEAHYVMYLQKRYMKLIQQNKFVLVIRFQDLS